MLDDARSGHGVAFEVRPTVPPHQSAAHLIHSSPIHTLQTVLDAARSGHGVAFEVRPTASIDGAPHEQAPSFFVRVYPRSAVSMKDSERGRGGLRLSFCSVDMYTSVSIKTQL